MGLYEIKQLLNNNNRKISKLKRPPTEWEKNLCQLCMRQGTDNQNTHGAQKSKLQKMTQYRNKQMK
jgi:hypothetical protein